jgi:hypothetical protein
MPETIKVPGATQLLVAADVNDQVGMFVVLAAYSAFVLSGRNPNSEMAYAAQIPQHFHDTATTVSARVLSLSASALMAPRRTRTAFS